MMYVHSRRNYTRKSTWEFTLIFSNQTHKNIHLNINTYYTHTHTHEECSWPFAWFCTVRNQRKNLALCKHKWIFVFRQEMPRKCGKSFKNLQKSWKIFRPHLPELFNIKHRFRSLKGGRIKPKTFLYWCLKVKCINFLFQTLYIKRLKAGIIKIYLKASRSTVGSYTSKVRGYLV